MSFASCRTATSTRVVYKFYFDVFTIRTRPRLFIFLFFFFLSFTLSKNYAIYRGHHAAIGSNSRLRNATFSLHSFVFVSIEAWANVKIYSFEYKIYWKTKKTPENVSRTDRQHAKR